MIVFTNKLKELESELNQKFMRMGREEREMISTIQNEFFWRGED